MNLGKITKLIDGELIGNPDIKINGANTLECAEKGDITFLANPKYKKWTDKTDASCIIVSKKYRGSKKQSIIKVDDPVASFSEILKHLYGDKKHPVRGKSKKAEISPQADIDKQVKIGDFVRIEQDAKIGRNTIVYPNVYIGKNSEIGNNCIIYPGVNIMDSVKIGNNVIIHAGTVIGSDGFGYSTENGKHKKIPQVGGVIVNDQVEIGANVTIDRGSPGNTIIGEGTKIDNLVQIAHNVKIGKSCLIVAQAGIAGSTIIEDNVVLAGQAGIVGHIKIGKGAQVGAQAGVTRNIKPGHLVSGYPAMNHSQAKRINALVRRLPQLFKQVEKLSEKKKNQ
ncbi:MAG: UDP-3-O-(3-hydroxymyristoyl)glucosamine N-acyltransferase [Elusimicrobiota bacterium]